ncbi:cardiolipin synthase [Alkalicoccus halolimnae]|uniref:Cardiolipin synthase n=1 Tax=Alkalicoccus halolimnae TaxID=1667239 RepID=A0A5C7FE14_9BACI|nr:cardiolipin synthase [Alkalicoccus halolimnae]TXF85547.1 cardiolipin synthase [Alkalicoccus halolimnae]
MEWWDYLGYLIVIINIFIGFIIIFREQKSASTTWAWLMVLFFVPVIGLLLYFLFGRELKKSRWDESFLYESDKILQRQQHEDKKEQFTEKGDLLKKQSSVMDIHLYHSSSPLIYGEEIEFILDGSEKFKRLYADIEQARSTIYVQYFGIEKDEMGRRFINLLTKKAGEGVEVFLLFDSFGSLSVNKKFLKDFRRAGGKAKAFFPLRTALSKATVNHRNHRKIVVIDEMIGYTGGFNVGDKYVSFNESLGYWRDTHLRMTGQAAFFLAEHVLSDWDKANPNDSRTLKNKALPQPPASGKGTLMQIVRSGPDAERDQVHQGFLKMVQEAEDYIYIQTPYFIPDSSLLSALRMAVLSGVQVKIMIPNKPDHPFVYWATYYYVGELLREGAEIYKYEEGFLHAKTLTTDDAITTVGTTNMDVRSVSLNFEMNVFLYDKALAHGMKASFEKDMQHCSQLTWDDYQKRSAVIRTKEAFSRLLSPLL